MMTEPMATAGIGMTTFHSGIESLQVDHLWWKRDGKGNVSQEWKPKSDYTQWPKRPTMRGSAYGAIIDYA